MKWKKKIFFFDERIWFPCMYFFYILFFFIFKWKGELLVIGKGKGVMRLNFGYILYRGYNGFCILLCVYDST